MRSKVIALQSNTEGKKEEVSFGSIVWNEVGGKHSVRSPIVVSPVVGGSAFIRSSGT